MSFRARELYLYDSHMGGLYLEDEELDYDDLYCEACNDSDEYLGVVNTISDIVELTKGICYSDKYIEEFIANVISERGWWKCHLEQGN